MSNPSNRASMRGQLTLRGVVIGVLCATLITASYRPTPPPSRWAHSWSDRLRGRHLAVLPKLMGNASPSTRPTSPTPIMSAGAMVAGGSGVYHPWAPGCSGYADQISWLDMFIPVALAGTILGPAGHRAHPPSLYHVDAA